MVPYAFSNTFSPHYFSFADGGLFMSENWQHCWLRHPFSGAMFPARSFIIFRRSFEWKETGSVWDEPF
jgi:hypothetical protein